MCKLNEVYLAKYHITLFNRNGTREGKNANRGSVMTRGIGRAGWAEAEGGRREAWEERRFAKNKPEAGTLRSYFFDAADLESSEYQSCNSS